MKYKLHENGWTVFADVDLALATTEELHELVKLCSIYTCVIMPEQELTLDREVEIIKSFPNPYIFYPKTHEDFKHFALDNDGYINRVTGQKNKYGRIGMTGHKSEGLWHNELPAIRSGSDVLWLYGLVGTKGSVTQWNNSIIAFKDLPNDTKNQIQHLKCIYYGGVNFSVERSEENFNKRKIYEGMTIPLINTNPSGQVGIHLSLHQFERFEGMSREASMEIAEPLFNFITNEPYVYTHHWSDKDSLFSDQWLAVHRRLGFDGMEDRILHKGCFNYPTI